MKDQFTNYDLPESKDIYSLQELSSKLQEKQFQLKDPILTYFKQFDEITGGFYPGELIVLSAPTKSGKTTFCQSITANMAEAGNAVLWFTLEMSWQELTRKFIKITTTAVPIFYPIDNSSLSVTWVKEVAEKAIKEKNVKLIIIDHLHFLLPLRDFHTNVSFLIGGIVRDIKRTAVELEIPIILIAHPGKLEDQDSISYLDIRDSSFITQESDFTIVMNRIRVKEKGVKEMVVTNEARISVELNRRTGNVGKLNLMHTNGRFQDPDNYVAPLVTKSEVKIEDIEF